MNENHRKGAVSEHVVITELVDRGYRVSVPVAPEPYDLVVDTVDGLKKVQVKSTDTQNGSLSANLLRTKNLFGDEPQQEYTEEQVDVFALYNRNMDITVYIPFEDTDGGHISIRYKEPVTGNGSDLHVEEYLDFPHGP